jgi:hypothetical protein
VWNADAQRNQSASLVPLVRRCRLGLGDVRRDPAENPESLFRKILPSFGGPHESALFAVFALEAEPSILVAHRDMSAGPEWIHPSIGLHAAVFRGIRRGGTRIVSPPVFFAPLLRRRTDEPHVPSVPIWINKISKAHFTHRLQVQQL